MRPRDAEHTMTKTFYQPLEIERDERLILDDEHVGRDLRRELAARFLDQFAQRGSVDIQDLGGIVLGQPFQCDQKERLARLGRYLREMPLDRLSRSGPCRPVVE